MCAVGVVSSAGLSHTSLCHHEQWDSTGGGVACYRGTLLKRRASKILPGSFSA